jgi:cellulose synthase/poly-beta-1,6-N-acetylglucosamine synthase-like glycosyltransferase
VIIGKFDILTVLGLWVDTCLIVVLIAGLVLSLAHFRMLFLHRRYMRAGLARERDLLNHKLPTDDELPDVLIQIPTFNEGEMIWRVLAAVTNIDWPHDRLRIQVLDDSTDESAEIARLAVREFQNQGNNVALIHRETRSGFKAGALKAGLAYSIEPYVVIFDADYVPSSDFLRKCMPALLADPNLAFAQARCDFLNANDNWLTRAQRVLLNCHFAVEQVTRDWAGQILPFNGTCGIWRRAAIYSAGGWQGDTLTEDLDLSYRAQLAGKRGIFLASVTVPGELPNTRKVWLKQQLRWNMGFAQNARKLLPDIWRGNSSWKRKLESTFHLCGCFHGVVLSATSALFWTDLLLGTMNYPIVLSLLILGCLFSIFGAGGMVIRSQKLLKHIEPERPAIGSLQVCAMTGALLSVHFFSGVMTAWGVLQGACGYHAIFERTSKKGMVENGKTALAAVTKLER